MTFIARLEGNKHHPAVNARAASKAGHVIHGRIFPDDFHKILQFAAHRLERNTLVCLNTAHQHAGILLREEGFRDGDIHPDVEHNGAHQHQPDKTRVVQYPFQRFAVAGLHRHQDAAKAFPARLRVRLAAL